MGKHLALSRERRIAGLGAFGLFLSVLGLWTPHALAESAPRAAWLQAAPPSLVTPGVAVDVPLAGSCPAASDCSVTLYYRPGGTATLDDSALLLAVPHWSQVTGIVSATALPDGSQLLQGTVTIPGAAVDSRGLLLIAALDATPLHASGTALGGARTLHAYWPGLPATDAAAVQSPPVVADVLSAGPGPLIAHVPPSLTTAGTGQSITWRVACSTVDPSTCTSSVREAIGQPSASALDGAWMTLEGESTGVTFVDGRAVLTFTATLPPLTTGQMLFYQIDASDGELRSTSPGLAGTGAPLAISPSDSPLSYWLLCS